MLSYLPEYKLIFLSTRDNGQVQIQARSWFIVVAIKKRHEQYINLLIKIADWVKDKAWNKLHKTSHKDWLKGYKKWKDNAKTT